MTKKVNDGMLEAVAFAFGRAQGFKSKTVMRKEFRAAAEAALRAMREPGESMLDAASALYCCPDDVGLYDRRDEWQAMVDAALAGG